MALKMDMHLRSLAKELHWKAENMIADPHYMLKQHTLSPQYGFLPSEPPLQRLLQEYYNPWESCMDVIAELVASHEVRQAIDAVPILSTNKLLSEEEWMRAYLVLSFMTHAYIWGGLKPAESLPASICTPYLGVAEHFGLPSTATYAALNLWNWAPKFEGADITFPENVRMLHTFTGTTDEEWFYAVSVSIEAEGAKIIPTMMECFDAVQADNALIIAQLLEEIDECIRTLGRILDRMHERCDPQIFYHRIRPLLAGTKGMAAAGLPRGVFYDEGAGKGTWRQYSGGSNAQSSLIQLLDIILGVEHYATDCTMSPSKQAAMKSKQGYIEDMRRYMPAPHKHFLHHIADIANIRAYATNPDVDPSVRKAYVGAVNSLTLFRDKHIQIVARYIVAPSRAQVKSGGNMVTNIATASMQQASGEGSERAAQLCGTGGTHLMPFLKQTRDETRQAGNLPNVFWECHGTSR